MRHQFNKFQKKRSSLKSLEKIKKSQRYNLTIESFKEINRKTINFIIQTVTNIQSERPLISKLKISKITNAKNTQNDEIILAKKLDIVTNPRPILKSTKTNQSEFLKNLRIFHEENLKKTS